MSPALISLAAQIGAPLVRNILSDKFGQGSVKVAEEVVTAVAERAGVSPDQIEQFAVDEPEIIKNAIRQVEGIAPELMRVAIAETEAREAILLAEIQKGGWSSRWRPLWMYLLGFLWLWQVVILHMLNAAFQITLPPAPWEYLMGISAVVWGIYSGGHTVKEVAKSWKGTR
ncbi:MAG: 3TM-type holin [Roseobacter sp.]